MKKPYNSNFYAKLHELASDNSLNLDEEFNDFVLEYHLISVKWGEKINITANLSPKEFILENVLDPLLAVLAVKSAGIFCTTESPIHIIDLGTGGGFVGILWHYLLTRQGRGVITVLLDGDRRKINFCKQVIRELGLSHIEAFHSRSEDYAVDHGGDFEFVVSRATWDFDDFINKNKILCSNNGHMISFESEKRVLQLQEDMLFKIPYTIQPGNIHRYAVVKSVGDM